MGENRDQSPLMVWADQSQRHSLSTRFLRCFCCCTTQDRGPLSWSQRFRDSVRNAVEAPQPKYRRLFQMMKNIVSKKSSKTANMAKSGSFHYDPLSYALNFDEGPNNDDENSWRAFSARFAVPVAMPREAPHSPQK